MQTHFEERLRRSLQARAAEVVPDPATWRKIEANIRRDHTFRLALSGVAIAAVVAVAAVVSPGLINRARIEFDPGPAVATQPALLEALGTSQPAGRVAVPRCGQRGGIAAVLATPGGDLQAACAAGGTEPLVEGPEIDAHPVIDGSTVYFDRRNPGDRLSRLMELDLATGELRSGDVGAWPARGPNGAFAYLVELPDDGRQPEIVVRLAPDEPIFWTFPVLDEQTEERSARHLSFDATGDRVFWEASSEGATTWFADVPYLKPTQLDPLVPEGASLASPLSREQDEVTAILRCCVLDEGDQPTSATLVRVTEGVAEPIADLAGIDGFDFRSADLFVAPAGQATLSGDRGRWLPGDQPAWLVGDGQRMFLVAVGRPAQLVSDMAASAAFNPAVPLDPGSPPQPSIQAPPSASPPVAPGRPGRDVLEDQVDDARKTVDDTLEKLDVPRNPAEVLEELPIPRVPAGCDPCGLDPMKVRPPVLPQRAPDLPMPMPEFSFGGLGP